MGVRPRPEAGSLLPDAHGGPDHGELSALGLRPEEVLDFSASTNAYGPHPSVLAALAGCDVTRYPDRGAEPLRTALAGRTDVKNTQVVCANGAAQLIWAITLAYLSPGDTAFVAGPTFGEYRVAAELIGARVVEWRAEAGANFVASPAALASAVADARPRVAWLCNPNNPTGSYLDRGCVAGLVESEPDTLWVIDEAYRPFVARPWPSTSLIERGNVVLLRSMTKDCALPGVRLGYAVGPETVIAAVQHALPPWSTSSVAIATGLAALNHQDYVESTVNALRGEAWRFRQELAGQGWEVTPSAVHFFLVHVGDAAGVRGWLLRKRHIQVRDCASFGLPEYIRVAARQPAENDRLIEAMGEVAQGEG